MNKVKVDAKIYFEYVAKAEQYDEIRRDFIAIPSIRLPESNLPQAIRDMVSSYMMQIDYLKRQLVEMQDIVNQKNLLIRGYKEHFILNAKPFEASK